MYYPPYVSMKGYSWTCCVFSLPGYRYLGDSGTDRRKILHDGTYWSQTGLLPFWGRYPQGSPRIRNFGSKFWPFDPEYLENGKSQCYMSVKAWHQLDEGFLKCKSWAVYPSGRDPPRMAGCLADALFNFWWSVVWLVGRTLLS